MQVLNLQSPIWKMAKWQKATASPVTRQLLLEDITTTDSRASWAALTSSLQFRGGTQCSGVLSNKPVRVRGEGVTLRVGDTEFLWGCELYLNKAMILKYQHNKRATLQRSQPAWEKGSSDNVNTERSGQYSRGERLQMWPRQWQKCTQAPWRTNS